MNGLPTNAGVEGFGAEDMIVPRRVMVQNTTNIEGMDTVPGVFVDPVAKVGYGKSMDVVVLSVQKSRALFFEQGSGKKGLRCYSNNGTTPAEDSEEKQQDQCQGCDHAFKDLQYDLLCYDVNESKEVGSAMVFWIRARGTSIKPTKNYVGSIVARKRLPLEFMTTLECAKSTGTKGSYFVLQFSHTQPTPEEIEADVVAAFHLYAGDGAQGEPEADPVDGIASSEVPF